MICILNDNFKVILCLFFFSYFSFSALGQVRVDDQKKVGIGLGPNESVNSTAVFEIRKQAHGSTMVGGLLLPRLTQDDINSLTSPAAGLLVYNITQQKVCFYNTEWVCLDDGSSGGSGGGQTITRTGTTLNLSGNGGTIPYALVPEGGDSGQVLTRSGSSGYVWQNVTGGGGTYSGSSSILLNGTSFERVALTGDVTAPLNSNTTTIANGAVNTAKIADNAVTTAKIASNAVTIDKLPAGATSTTYLKGDGTWGTPTGGGGSYSGSSSIALNGSSFERAALTGDVTAEANSNVTTISNGAVTTDKIANSAVTTDKIGNNEVTIAKLPAGASDTTFLRGDGEWVTLPTGAGISGTGTLNYIPKFTPNGTTLGNSIMRETNSGIGIDDNNDVGHKLTVNGRLSLHFGNKTKGNILIGQGVAPNIPSGVNENVVIGRNAGVGLNNGGSNYNVVIGANADVNQFGSSVVIGHAAIASQAHSTVIGRLASASSSNSIAIGYNVAATSANSIVLGNSTTTSASVPVSWTISSDGRFKTNVQATVKGLDFIKKLKPVQYKWDIKGMEDFIGIPDSLRLEDSRISKESIVYTGFIAQEVEEAATQVGFDFSGISKPNNEAEMYGLRYSEFVVPLVKAVQEQQVIIEDMRAEAQSKNILIEDLIRRIEALEQK